MRQRAAGSGNRQGVGLRSLAEVPGRLAATAAEPSYSRQTERGQQNRRKPLRTPARTPENPAQAPGEWQQDQSQRQRQPILPKCVETMRRRVCVGQVHDQRHGGGNRAESGATRKEQIPARIDGHSKRIMENKAVGENLNGWRGRDDARSRLRLLHPTNSIPNPRA